jgi:hypothetical protein
MKTRTEVLEEPAHPKLQMSDRNSAPYASGTELHPHVTDAPLISIETIEAARKTASIGCSLSKSHR